MGKGSVRRPEDSKKIAHNWDLISNWGLVKKGKSNEAQRSSNPGANSTKRNQ